MRNKTGKLILGTLWGMLVVLAVLLGGWRGDLIAQQQSRAGAIRVVLQPSGVARQRGPQVVRTTAEKDMAVFYQDVLETGVGGRMRARLDDGSILSLGSQSRLTVVEHNTATEQTTLQLQYGKVRAQVVEKTRPDSKFEVQTNTAVAGVLGTDEVVDATSPVSTMVLCIEGQIEVRNADAGVVGTVILNAGEITFVNQGVVPTPPRPATPQEIQEALEGSGGAAPEAVADIGTGFVTAGDNLLLSAADSFVTGTIVSYQWVITREANNQTVFNQSQAEPDLVLDTTTLEPGNYLGTLTITTSNNETATTSFGFVVLPSEISNTSPELVIQQMQLAYETLQPNEFMKLFDPLKYVGYAALQQSVEASFRNLSQARVFVRRANGQIFEEGHVAIYQVDFEIRFSTKAEPDKTYVTREQATLRMESGSGWLITDVPQGQVGGGGLLAIPGVGNPDEVNTVPATGNPGTGVPNIVPQGGQVVVLAGGSNTFEIQNTSTVAVTISFDPPPGIRVTGGGDSGTTFTILPGETLVIVFTAESNQPAGTVSVPTSITSGNSTLPGPTIPVTVGRLSLNFPDGGSSAASPLPVLLGFDSTASVRVESTVSTGYVVDLSASGGDAGVAFSPNPVEIAEGTFSGEAGITVTPNSAAQPGAGEVAVSGTAQASSAEGTLFINRIAPFTLTRTSPDSQILLAGQNGAVTFNVAFNAPFAGPAQIEAPSATGLSFSPQTATVNGPGAVAFTVTAGPNPTNPAELEFTATAGTYEATSKVTLSVALPPLQCNLTASPSSLSIAPGQSGGVTVTVEVVAGAPRSVEVVAVNSGFESLFTVSGGGTLPNAAGQVSFTVTAQANTPPGSGSFLVTAPGCGTTPELGSPAPELEVEVTVLGEFSFAGPASVSLLRGGIAVVPIDVNPTGGFNAPIDLAYACSGGDVTASGPLSLPPGQRSFDVSFAGSATADLLSRPTCSVQGTSGTASDELAFQVFIGSFTLTSTAPLQIPLVIGIPVALPVTVTAAEGFTGDVALTVEAANGVSVTPPNAVVPGGNGQVVFTLSAAPGTPAGLATVSVTGTAEGGLLAELDRDVLVTEGFSLSSNPAIFFLGNRSPLVVSIRREAVLQGGVLLEAGSLPAGIVEITPSSVIVPAGVNSATFEVLAGANPSLSGQPVTIPITGTAVPGATLAGASRSADDSRRLFTLNATGTLQAPFTLSGGEDLGTVDVGESETGSVTVGFAQGFTGTVQVSTSAPSGVNLEGGSAELTANGEVEFTATPNNAGSFTILTVAEAGNFSLEAEFDLEADEPPPPPPPPPPAFSLCVKDRTGPCLTDSDFVGVNSTIPAALQVSVIPGTGFTSPVTVTVTDGALMKFFAGCGTPSGGSYTGGTLTFTLTSPYTSPANFCMSAGVPVAPTSDDGVTFTGTPTSGAAAVVGPTFRIGVPVITVTPDTFTLLPTFQAPANEINLDIALAATSPANVFDLPVTVFVTGPDSALTGTGPFLDSLPSTITSDCGPNTSGKTILAGGGSVSCKVTHNDVDGESFNSAGNLAVFVTFGPGGGVNIQLTRGCAAGPGQCRGAQTERISSGLRKQGVGDGEKSDLVIAPESVQFTPLAPKPGDTVSIQARVENHTGTDADGVKVGLLLNGAAAATMTVSVPAGGTQPVEFVWQAEYYQRLSFEISLQAADGTAHTVPVRNLFVEPELTGTFNQGRSELAIVNGDCGGFRFVLGTQTFCGGSSDLELSPVITGDGQLLVQAFSLNGGIMDLGPQPITGQLTVPEAGYAAKGWLEPGRLYAVESQGKYGLLYVSRIHSDIDPRLARLTRGQTTDVGSLDDVLSDRLDDLLDRSRVTVVVEWAYLENGSRRFSYGFSGVERGTRPGVIRQPRVPATPQRQ